MLDEDGLRQQRVTNGVGCGLFQMVGTAAANDWWPKVVLFWNTSELDGWNSVSLTNDHQPSDSHQWGTMVHGHSDICAPALRFCIIELRTDKLVANEGTSAQ